MHTAETETAKGGGHDDQDLHLKVIWADDDANVEIRKTAKVSDLIAFAVGKLHLAPGDKYDVSLPKKPGEPLDHNRTLVSYHLKDGDELLLTATGGGV